MPTASHADVSAHAEAFGRQHRAMLSPDDVAYVTANFVPLTDATVRAEIAAGRLPKPARRVGRLSQR
jgi:hypothetical protein